MGGRKRRRKRPPVLPPDASGAFLGAGPTGALDFNVENERNPGVQVALRSLGVNRQQALDRGLTNDDRQGKERRGSAGETTRAGCFASRESLPALAPHARLVLSFLLDVLQQGSPGIDDRFEGILTAGRHALVRVQQHGELAVGFIDLVPAETGGGLRQRRGCPAQRLVDGIM